MQANNMTNSQAAANSIPVSANQRFGLTDAIDISGPTPEQLAKTEELIKSLQEMNVFESDDELHKRFHF
jgi:poly(A) polymerase Pap1